MYKIYIYKFPVKFVAIKPIQNSRMSRGYLVQVKFKKVLRFEAVKKEKKKSS